MFTILSVIVLLLLLVVLVRIPKVQTYLVQKAAGFVSDRTNTRVHVGFVGINFPKTIILEDVFAEDLSHDTLVYIGRLEVDVNMPGLLNNNLHINDLELSRATIKLKRTLPDSTFNFQFLIDAFASKEKNSQPDKDTSASNFKIGADDIAIFQTNFLFEDETSGLKFTAHAGEIELGMERITLDSLLFYADDITIKNTHTSFTLTKQNPPQPDNAATGQLPYLKANDITLSNMSFVFDNVPADDHFTFRALNINARPRTIDLNRSRIEMNSILIDQPEALISLGGKTDTTIVSTLPDTNLSSQWQVVADEAVLSSGVFRMDNNSAPRTNTGMDYNHLFAQKINLTLSNGYYSAEQIRGNLEHLSLNEQCGLELKKLSTLFTYDDRHAELSRLKIITPRTNISNYLSVSYRSINDLAKNPGLTGIHANFTRSRVHLEDILLFAPQLISQPPFNNQPDKVITMNGKIRGSINNLHAEKLIVTAGNQTAISTDAHITGLPDINKTYFDINLKSFSSSEEDVYTLAGREYIPETIKLPVQFMATGTYKGSIRDFAADISLVSTQGNADAKVTLNMGGQDTTYVANVKTDNLDLGYLLKNQSLGKITGYVSAKGRSFNVSKMTAEVEGKINAIGLNRYVYHNIGIKAENQQGLVKGDISIDDKNIMLTLNANGNLTANSEQLQVFMNLRGANLQALGLTEKDVRTAAQLQANIVRFDPEWMSGYMGIGGLTIMNGQARYRVDSIVATTENEPGKHIISLRNSIVTADYNGTISPDKIGNIIVHHFKHYLDKTQALPDTAAGQFTFTADIKPSPVLTELLLPELDRFSGVTIKSSFNAATHEMSLVTKSNQIVYAGTDVRALDVNASSSDESLKWDVKVNSISSGNLRLPETSIAGQLSNGIADVTTTVIHKDSGNKLMMRNEITFSRDRTVISIKDNSITLNNGKWAVPGDNRIVITSNGVNIRNLVLRQDEKLLSAKSADETNGAPIDIRFEHFNLGEISQVIESEKPMFRGELQGTVRIEKMSPVAFTSSLEIDSLSYQDILLGNLSIKADNLTANRYTANMELKGNQNNMLITGYFENNKLNFEADIRRINIVTIEPFTAKQIRNSNGFLSGKFNITGSTSEPILRGYLTFNQASVILNAINSRITMREETILIDEKGAHFKRFTVHDTTGQPLVVNGDVLTTDFTNLTFNLDVRTQRFRVLNTTVRDNREYYGSILLNSIIKIRGTDKLPVVDADVKLLAGSNFTYVVQQGELRIDYGEDIVQVINRDTGIFFRPEDTSAVTSEFRGIDINVNIEVDRNTAFTVIIDPVSGDMLEVSGDAQLNFAIDQSGKMSLQGTYTLSDGSYKASFKNVVKEEFIIRRGSSITWTGDPLSARIDITAVYKVMASAQELLAAELAGMSDSERNAYRKLLGYNVNMFIRGELQKPELSFRIDLVEKDKNAFGGMVDARLNTINSDPSELNKQVFALLILKRFLPPSYLSTSGTGNPNPVSTIARNSVNQVLSDQLNALSGRYIKGAELNFNIQSNDIYSAQGTVQPNTEVQVGLRRQLFGERLSVQVGSSINVSENNQQNVNQQNVSQQNITGDIVVEYKITDDGRYRFKAFRENGYEGLIDGMLYKTGAGIMYNKDYNTLKELFSKPKKEEDIILKDSVQ